jgi:hypothetical protein
VIVCAAYFAGYVKPSHHPSLLSALRNPEGGGKYFLACLGCPFAVEPMSGVGIGAVVLALYLLTLVVHRKRVANPADAFPAALIAFAVASALMLVAGRSGFGVDQGLSSRYATLELTGIAGLWLLTPGAGALRGALMAITSAGLIVGLYDGIQHGNVVRRDRKVLADSLLNFETEPDSALGGLYPDVPELRRLAVVLKMRRLSVFRHAVPSNQTGLRPAGAPPRYAIDSVKGGAAGNDGSIHLPGNATLIIEGWAFDPARAAPGQAVLFHSGSTDFKADYCHPRQDVADANHSPAVVCSAFRATIAAAALSPGEHRFSLWLVDRSGHTYFDSGPVLRVQVESPKATP